MRPACKWALYGAAHLLANGAAVLIFRQYLNISWFSLLPVIYTVAFFILFFPPVVKALYVLFPVLAPLVYVAALIIRAKVKGELPPPAESEKAKQERELKEQQQREELGHWK